MICLINFIGEKAIWRGISKADRDAVKSLIKKELIEKKILELQSSEESDFQITIELYKKYDNLCRENKCATIGMNTLKTFYLRECKHST